MTFLGEIWHIVKKDIRQSWWLFGAYLTLIAAATVGAVSGEELAGGKLQWAAVLLIFTGPFIAAVLIQSDSPTVADAFWASKPFRPSAMLGAKLLLVVGLLLLLPLIGQWLGLVAFDVPRVEQRSILLASAVIYGLVLLLSTFLAALTPDLKSFVLGVVAFLIAILVLSILMSDTGEWWGASFIRIAAATLGLAGIAMLLVLLYLRRNVPAARKFGVLALGLLLLGSISTGNSEPSRPPGEGSIMHPVGKASVAIALRDTAAIAWEGRVHLRITLVGADSGQRFRLDRPRTRFFLHDGTTVTMPLWELGATILYSGPPELPNIRSLQEDLSRISGPTTGVDHEVSGELRRSLISGIDSVQLTGTLTRLEPRIFATLPLRVGAAVRRDGQSTKISALALGSPDVLLEVEMRTVGTARDRANWMNETTGPNAFLVNQARGEGMGLPRKGSNSNPGILVLPAAGVQQGSIRYMAPRTRNGGPNWPDAQWLSAAKLMLLEWTDGPSTPVRASSVPMPPEPGPRARNTPPMVISGPSGMTGLSR
jgi:hypothetical protein